MAPFVLSQVLMRSRVLRENGKYIPRQVSGCHLYTLPRGRPGIIAVMCVCACVQSFAMRKHYFNNAETGFFKKVKRKVVPKNPMTGEFCVSPVAVDSLDLSCWKDNVHLSIS